ncbi:hypothetical protein [Hahella sp. NBU794]|uniref:hypothetical protein n=1 Tax=Hahella sp. NBU794 TaxID=3422590 RepID=UPI003D701523
MSGQDRWPPIYDSTDLEDAIKQLSSSADVEKNFYIKGGSPDVGFCQGDIIRLGSGVPVIWEDGKPAVQSSSEYWLIIGNTCDISRPVETLEWSQLAPIVKINKQVSQENLDSFLKYQYSRRFYLPPWKQECANELYFADFVRPVTIHKTALFKTTIESQMSRFSWLLLHSCLVRFLARDDGRFEAS